MIQPRNESNPLVAHLKPRLGPVTLVAKFAEKLACALNTNLIATNTFLFQQPHSLKIDRRHRSTTDRITSVDRLYNLESDRIDSSHHVWACPHLVVVMFTKVLYWLRSFINLVTDKTRVNDKLGLPPNDVRDFRHLRFLTKKELHRRVVI